MHDVDVRDQGGRALRIVVSCAVGFPAAWILARHLPRRPHLASGGMDLTLMLVGCVALSILICCVLTVIAKRRRHERIPRAVARVARQ